jgi:cell division protein FtsL
MSNSDRNEVRPGLFDWLNRILVVLIVLAIVVAIGLNYVPLIRQNQMLREKLQLRQEEVARLNSELRRLDSENRALQNDPRHVERKVRELGYARPDELVVTFRDPARP